MIGCRVEDVPISTMMPWAPEFLQADLGELGDPLFQERRERRMSHTGVRVRLVLGC